MVEKTGSEVRALRRGDEVLAPFFHYDDTCAYCRAVTVTVTGDGAVGLAWSRPRPRPRSRPRPRPSRSARRAW
ncbi:hypothetical protein GCM10023220_05640 [Streptomyces ziwulingensis]|uniref:Uncharacterized protein n=1 Tax=Streptomyces ziwulingensis TaxID=1045501 RepID=A0ABP9ATU6_9ACTN